MSPTRYWAGGRPRRSLPISDYLPTVVRSPSRPLALARHRSASPALSLGDYLRAANKELAQFYGEEEALNNRLDDEREKLLALLRRLERSHTACGTCYRSIREGHADHCELAAALV